MDNCLNLKCGKSRNVDGLVDRQIDKQLPVYFMFYLFISIILFILFLIKSTDT